MNKNLFSICRLILVSNKKILLSAKSTIYQPNEVTLVKGLMIKRDILIRFYFFLKVTVASL